MKAATASIIAGAVLLMAGVLAVINPTKPGPGDAHGGH
ncbi:hypothetical protein J2805_003617 [Arthrobacter oryzae]|nr:hypothetical protein [Arthrobacter oryzae]